MQDPKVTVVIVVTTTVMMVVMSMIIVIVMAMMAMTATIRAILRSPQVARRSP